MPERSSDSRSSWRSGKTAAERGYGGRWQRERVLYLKANPLCRLCRDSGRLSAATVVDHIEPHHGDQVKFWDVTNWQALCKTCHDGAKQAQERSGRLRGCDANGWPLDPTHHWSTNETTGGG